jgi:Zn ribbon nucleic-acid-binding protein
MARVGTLETQIVTGECPECNTNTMLVSWSSHIYRCVNCGHDLEQKVNGVIKYVIADRDTQLTARNLDDEHG